MVTESDIPRPRRRRKRAGPSSDGMPSLTSLMDIVTIILIYFVKTFAVSPIAVQDPSVQLPSSTSMENTEDATVVMITGAKRRENINGHQVMVGEVPNIVIDDRVVAQLDAEYRVPADLKQHGIIIVPLKKELLEVRQKENQTAELVEEGGFSGKIVIIADRDTPYRVLNEVLVTCGSAGFSDFKFVIVKEKA